MHPPACRFGGFRYDVTGTFKMVKGLRKEGYDIRQCTDPVVRLPGSICVDDDDTDPAGVSSLIVGFR